jgi:hypothetical protein
MVMPVSLVVRSSLILMAVGVLTVEEPSLERIPPRSTDLLPMLLVGLPSLLLLPTFAIESLFSFHMLLVFLILYPSTSIHTEQANVLEKLMLNLLKL